MPNSVFISLCIKFSDNKYSIKLNVATERKLSDWCVYGKKFGKATVIEALQD